MNASEFPEVNVRIAEKQEEFQTIPAFWNKKEGSMTFCFKLSESERNRMYATGEVWMKVYTGGREFHPIGLSTNKE
jgi:hypothetical protein